ncbi:MAG: hypothetical protein EBS47_12500 [Betaproteobacteria bacterium]|nr:hypothetical protein [Betaproteobacteria bacterium]
MKRSAFNLKRKLQLRKLKPIDLQQHKRRQRQNKQPNNKQLKQQHNRRKPLPMKPILQEMHISPQVVDRSLVLLQKAITKLLVMMDRNI